MTSLKLKFKRIGINTKIPTRANPGDAGLDLIATTVVFHEETASMIYGTGLCVEIPEGYVGLLFPRSSIYLKEMRMANSVGVIDSGYRGEIKVVMRVEGEIGNTDTRTYVPGEKVAQLVLVPCITPELEEVQDFEVTTRGTGGFGSSGK